MLILGARDTLASLPMRELIGAMKLAFAALSDGRVIAPPRLHLDITRHRGTTLVMPACVGGEGDEAMSVKVVSLFEGNADRGLPFIQAAVLALDPATGQPTALIEGATLTARRTGAASGAATDLLARRDARTVAVFGAGVQARTQLEAVCAVRPIETAYIVSRTRASAERLADDCRQLAGIRIADAADALARADIVCAATTSIDAVFDDADVRPGTHINACGSYKPHAREVPAATVARAAVYVDHRQAAWSEAGDLIQPLDAGLIDRSHVLGELGELVLGRVPGRSDERQVTFFKSVGHAVQDAFAARLAIGVARESGLGVEVAF